MIILLNNGCKVVEQCHQHYMLTEQYLSFCIIFLGGITNLQCCKYCHLPGDFSSHFQSSMTIFHHNLLARGCRGFGQWTNSSIIHGNVCSLIHKKCHPKSCHSDIKYHMTLNIVFSASVCEHAQFVLVSSKRLLLLRSVGVT